MNEQNNIPPVPMPQYQDMGQGYANPAQQNAYQASSQGAYAAQGAAPFSGGYSGNPAYAGQVPPVVVQMPPQKKSRGWIVALIIAVALIIGSCLLINSCATVVAGSMSGLSSFSSAGSVLTSGDTVAVIHVDAQIAGSGSGSVTPEGFRDCLRDAEEDSNVKAIVLRVNCGGGTAGASEEIATYVKKCTKPVVISVSDSCYSGAYWMASQADYIIAMPTSGVGSIGVRMTIANYEELLDMLGIDMDVIASGEDKDMGSGYRALSDEERAALQTQVNEIHNLFVTGVAEGRGLPKADVEKIATGMTFNAASALDMGLVDELGTFDDALAKAAELGGISGEYNTVDFDAVSVVSLLDMLS